jgi:hypothetical protein
VDVVTGDKSKQWAFLIEDTAQLRDRVGLAETIDNAFNLPRDTFHDNLLKIAAVYQYMIGNSDWSIPVARNLKYMSKNGKIIPIPYDFDFSGLVNASYAVPSPDHGIPNVRTRIFLGFPEDTRQLKGTLSYFRTKRRDLFRTVNNFKALDKDSKTIVSEYLASFFATMNEISL